MTSQTCIALTNKTEKRTIVQDWNATSWPVTSAISKRKHTHLDIEALDRLEAKRFRFCQRCYYKETQTFWYCQKNIQESRLFFFSPKILFITGQHFDLVKKFINHMKSLILFQKLYISKQNPLISPRTFNIKAEYFYLVQKKFTSKGSERFFLNCRW